MSSAEIISTGRSTDKDKFSFSREEDGIKKTITGSEVENGWLIRVEKEWEEKSPDGSSEWKFNKWEYISPTDPRETIKEQQQPTKPVIDTNMATEMLKSVSQSQGLLIVT